MNELEMMLHRFDMKVLEGVVYIKDRSKEAEDILRKYQKERDMVEETLKGWDGLAKALIGPYWSKESMLDYLSKTFGQDSLVVQYLRRNPEWRLPDLAIVKIKELPPDEDNEAPVNAPIIITNDCYGGWLADGKMVYGYLPLDMSWYEAASEEDIYTIIHNLDLCFEDIFPWEEDEEDSE